MNRNRTRLSLVLLLWLCLAVACCGARQQAGRPSAGRAPSPTVVLSTPVAKRPTVAPSPTLISSAPATTRPTLVPPPPATATLSNSRASQTVTLPTPLAKPLPASDVLDDLARELYVGVGGQGMWGCMLHAPPSELPGATADVFDLHHGAVCLWGFPVGRDVSVELYDPSGRLIAAKAVTIAQEWDGVGVAEIYLSLVGRPTGTWAMVATLDGASVTTPIYVKKPGLAWVSVVSAELDPFLGYGWMPPRGSTLAPSDYVTVFGDGFPPGRTLPLGFYYRPESDYPDASQLVYSQVVVADDQGSFAAHISVQALARQGDGVYHAVVPLSPAYDPNSPTLWELGAWAPFVVASNSDDTAPS